MGNLARNRNRNTSVHGTAKWLRARVLKLSRRIRELATHALLDNSIVAQTLRVVSDGIAVGIAEINSFFVDY